MVGTEAPVTMEVCFDRQLCTDNHTHKVTKDKEETQSI